MKIVIVSGLHGDEPAGNEAAKFFKYKPSIKVLSHCNPFSSRRFQGKDLNRHFDTDDEGPIQKYIIKSIERLKPKLVIDLHEDNDSKGVYVFCSPDMLSVCKKCLKDIKLPLAKSVAGDKTEKGIIINGHKRFKNTLAHALERRKIPNILIETPSTQRPLKERTQTLIDIVSKIIEHV